VSRIYIAGLNGLIGTSLANFARSNGHKVFGKSSTQLNLTDRLKTFQEFQDLKPEILIIAAAKVGGIGANSRYPVNFLSTNLQIQTNVIDAAFESDIERVVFLGSSCIYPKLAHQPISEDSLLTGELEPSNQAYAISKIAGIELINSYRQQYGRNWISIMPCNLYGPNDNFDPNEGHVLASLIYKIHQAKVTEAKSVTLWGDGSPTREFLHVDDAAQGILHLAQCDTKEAIINLGSGLEISIRTLAEKIADVIGFTGEIVFDHLNPNGTPRKVLEVSRAAQYGWNAKTPLSEGIQSAYEWFIKNPTAKRSLT
jgi:GDP-L-fucose synthase